jgi:hypothetical protein
MNATRTFFSFCTIILFTGCIGRQAFYVSPFNGLNNPYHTIPLKKDSTKSAFYANGALAFGSANDYGGDKTFAADVNLSHSLNFGDFQAFYGVGFSAGSYKVDKFETQGNNGTVDPGIINANAGKKNFSGYGFDGGINYTVPIRNGEWRVIGFETSLRKEAGRYLEFRKNLPASAATLIIRKDVYGTAGGYSEIIGHSNDFSYGFKLGIGTVLGKDYHERNIVDSDFNHNRLNYNYANGTLHFSKKKFTGYIQFNNAEKAGSFMMGANYRLGR